jgi:hypothetical protein
MGKIIIMSSNPQVTPSGDVPLTPNDLRNMTATIDIFRTLGGVVALEAKTNSHGEKIEQLLQWGSAIPHIENDVAQNKKDLNELGRRHTKELNELGMRLGKEIGDLKVNDIGDLKSFVHTAKILGYIALTLAGIIGTALVTYLKTK